MPRVHLPPPNMHLVLSLQMLHRQHAVLLTELYIGGMKTTEMLRFCCLLVLICSEFRKSDKN
jgi:hypothetical protein